MLKAVIKLFVLSVLFASLLSGASFDCKKATTKIEKTICSDDKLSKADEELSRIYKEVLRNARQNKLSKQDSKQLLHFFIQKQRAWLKNRNKHCKNYTSNELKKCLSHHYKSQINKLKPLIDDGGFLYSNYEHIAYRYTHRPYLEFAFSEVLKKDSKSFKKIKKQLLKWEEGYEICRDKYGVMDENCVLEVAKKQRKYYDNLLKKYKSQKYLIEDNECKLLERASKSFMAKDSEMCFLYDYYTLDELSKLLHAKGVLDIKDVKLEDLDETKPCNVEEVRFNSTLEQNIIFINKNVFTLQTTEYSYTGGAHGDFATNYDNIDRNSGKQIGWNDIFKDKKKPLYRFIVDNMKQIVGFAEFESYSDDKLYNMALSAVIAIVDDGLKITFGLYEISGYADGEPSFTIPHELLKKVIGKKRYEYYFKNDDVRIDSVPETKKEI